MLVPLVLLAVLAVVSGYRVHQQLAPRPAAPMHHEFHVETLDRSRISIAALVLGLIAGFVLYRARKRTRSPSRCSATASTSTASTTTSSSVISRTPSPPSSRFFDEFLINGLHRRRSQPRRRVIRQPFPQSPVRQPPGLRLRLRPRRHPRHLFHRFLIGTRH